MIARLEDNQWIYLDNLSVREEEIVWQEFSVSKPGIYIDPNQMGTWDGVHRKYNRAKKRMARPLLSKLRGVCTKHNLAIDIRDYRPDWNYQPLSVDQINADFLPGITLEQYQIDCIRKIASVECGVIDVPTGGGKGELIAGACKAISCPTIVLADQVIVVKQLKERLELRDVVDDVGIFYAGKRPNGQSIVVGSIQSLTAPSKPPDMPVRRHDETDRSFTKKLETWDKKLQAFKTRRRNTKLLTEYVKRAEMIIVDECDKCTGDSWKNLFRHQFRGRRRFGFSGTPFDTSKPVEGMVMQEHLGSVIYKASRAELTALGRIIPCEYYMLAYGMDRGTIDEASAYDIAYNEHLVNNEHFHRTVAKLARHAKKDPMDGVLVLVDREPLGYKLVEACTAQNLRVAFIFGKTTQKKRAEMLRAFERRELDVLIGGKIINRGLDLKGGCESLIVASGGKLESEFIQKIGRALRRNRLGKSKVYGFFFRCNRYLYRHSKAHLKAMINAEYPTKIVFPGGSITGEELVQSQFRVKRSLLG